MVAAPGKLSLKGLLAALAFLCAPAQAAPDYDAARERMMRSVSDYARPIGGRESARVLAAMRAVPRHELVPARYRDEAYDDHPLPIGEGQTISQPSLVALMTHLLDPDPGERVLEVGTGSGYQAAILSRLVDHVYTIEIVRPLAQRAARDLDRLGYRNVSVRHGDGYAGWPSKAPFDGIVVTAGAPRVPPPLIRQLKPGGRMVIPVGPAHAVQELLLVTKGKDGKLRSRKVIPVRFVPLTGKGAQD
ncbi:MAG: protein-L-isoaspartate(D-aspartate) O-methyltransferase [Sphingomonadaceae bacterium]